MNFYTDSQSITQKRMILKCSNLVQGMTLGYPTSDMVLELKGQRSRLGIGLAYNNMAWVRTVSAFLVMCSG